MRPSLPLLAARKVLFAVALCAACAHAQFRASIQGTVTDPEGAVIPNATLILTDSGTGRSLTATSNSSGVYNFNALPPDHFTLTATAPNFNKKVVDTIEINPDQVNAVNVQLTVGGTDTTVNVFADQTAAIETATASISGTVSENEVQHLPSAGRDVFQLVQLAPGVFGDASRSGSGGNNNLPGSQGPGGSGGSGVFQTENGPQANANGGQYETNGISIDGISTVSAVWGGTSVITPNEDSVGSVKVLSNGYDAENGRFSGAQIEITSKTGTNDVHGSLFFRANRPGLNAYQRYNTSDTFLPGVHTPAERGLQRDTTRSNQYGGSVGGPLLRNRLFAFFAYETQRDGTSATGTGWYETAAFRALAPPGSIAATYLGFPGGAVSANAVIEQTCADAGLVEGTDCHQIAGQGLNLGSPLNQARGTQDLSWQSTTNPGTGGGLGTVADVALYNTLNPNSTIGNQYNGRLDGDVTRQDHVAFAIYWVPLTRTNYIGTDRPYNLFHHNQINEAYTVIWNHVFAPSFLNEARVNDAGWRWNEVTSNPQEPFGLPQSTIDATGNFTLNFFGAPGPSNLNQHTYTYKDVATKVQGNHNNKFGGEVTRLYYLNNPTGSARPNYNFYNIWDFLNDAPHAEFGSFNPATGTPTTNRQDTREDLYGFFAQDNWQARQNLTINAGLRYSYFGALSSKENNLNAVLLGSGASTYTGLTVRRGGNLTTPQKGNFGPQFGFAFSPDTFHGKAVLRGGYGLNFNQTEIATTGNAGSNPPDVTNVAFNGSSVINGVATIDPRIVYGVAADAKSLFGYPPNPNTTGGFNSANLPSSGGVSLVAFPQNQPTIYTQHVSLDTQFDLGHQFVASVGYQGSLSRHLIVQSFLYANAFANSQPLNPLVSNVQFFGNTGHSSNHSLLAGFKHQMSHHFMIDAEFTWSKTMDTGSGPYFTDPYPFRPDLAWGRSDFNYGKAAKIYGLWQPVFFRSNSLLEKVAGGWSISGIYNVHSGFPFTPTYHVQGGNLYYGSSPYNSLRPAAFLNNAGHNTSNAALEAGRPNLNFPNIPTGATTSPYFVDPVAPVAPGNGLASGLPQLPGVARNSFNGPGYQDVDATVTKSFGIPKLPVLGESGRLEVRADAFNLFNLTNLDQGSVVTDILQTNFGQAQRGLAGRIVNLQARFSF